MAYKALLLEIYHVIKVSNMLRMQKHFQFLLKNYKKLYCKSFLLFFSAKDFVVVVALLFYVHGKHLRSCRDDQLT